MESTPKLSLVTGKIERDESFDRLVRSIIANTECSWELIVADASAVPCAFNAENIRVIRDHPRAGYVKAYNRAFKECRGEYVLYLNDDAEVLPGYDKRAVGFMDEHPEIGLGCLAFSDRLWADFRVCTFWGIPYANFGIIRREIGNKIGWFWNSLEMYGSDNAITFDVLLAGHGVAAIHGPLIHHHRPPDQIREENQKNRPLDNDRITRRYQPYLQDLRHAYAQHLRSVVVA